MGKCGCHTHPIIFFEKIDGNEIAWISHNQAFAEEFSEPVVEGGGRNSVAEGNVE